MQKSYYVFTPQTTISDFLNWGGKNPDNYRNNEDCLEMHGPKTRLSGKWNDLNCRKKRFFVCQRPTYRILADYGIGYVHFLSPLIYRHYIDKN